ncbi:MAG TPA: acyl-CoA dehydrogenase family protein [Myxococcota bacterium]|nr:acyl-CoA dehydrogenase family protein [Myxococcota bacterium]
MNFGFTEEQELLRAEVRKFLDQNCPLEEVRKLAETESGFSKDFWMRMAELGWVGLTFPEAHGGVGLGWEDLVVVLEETGRTLFPSPLIATVLAGNAIARHGDAAQQKRWLPRLASGAAIGTFAYLEAGDAHDPAAIALRGRRDGDGFVLDGEKLFVPDAASADLFVVAFRTGDAPDALSLAVIERGAKGVTALRDATMDETKRTGRLRLESVRVGRDALLGEPGRAAAAIARILDEGALAVAAEAVGAAEAVHQLTTHYAKQRIQFDKPIGQFQGVKHPLAVAYVDIESWRSLAYYAAWALDAAPSEAPLAVSRAKAYASDAFPRIGIEAVGLHGGIGYTWEYDAQLYLKRAKWMRPAFGDADHHFERAARLGGL